MLTDDENIIDIQFAVQYNLKSAEAYLFNVRKPDLIVQFIAQTAMGEVVGKAKMDFALYEGREQIAKSAEKLMQEMLDRYQTGIFIQKVALQSVQPPDKVQAAFDDAVKAGQDRDRFRNEGQAYANDVVPRARGNAARDLLGRQVRESDQRGVRAQERMFEHLEQFPADRHRPFPGLGA
jgi:membrane protease subunit HflK